MRLSPGAFLAWIAEQGMTICDLPTPLAELVLSCALPAQLRLRLLIAGGDQLHHTPPEDAPFMLINTYGPTENTVMSTWAVIPPGKLEEGRFPVIGRPVPNTQVYVLSQAGEPQPIGVPGELALGGESLALGYLNRADLTAASFIPDRFSGRAGARLYRTGDIGRYLSDGTLEFLGRTDQQVKIRGFRVELGEIEALLGEYPGVHEAVVVVNETLPGEKRLVAYILPRGEVTLRSEDLQHFLKERVPDYMVPGAFSPARRAAADLHGKVDRQALATRQLITLPASEHPSAPRDALELQLAHLWEKLLGTSPIGVTDNFFQLGGHSLTGVRLMSQIRRQFGLDLPVSTLFREGTIASLATLLRRREAEISFTPLVPIQPQGSRPPLFCVHPSGGEVLCYLQLAHQLGSDQPVYGLRAAGPEQQEIGSSLVEMASAYREALCVLQPQGPYLLSGWSMGGVIAFEIARQLEAQGQHVAFLGLIDSYPPPTQVEEDEGSLMRQFLSDLADSSEIVFSSAEAEKLAERELPADLEQAWPDLLRRAQQARLLPADVDIGYLKRLFLIFKKNLEVLGRYRPGPYGGEVRLFQASASSEEEREGAYGWPEFAARVTAQEVPGTHYSMLRDPQVETLARLVHACLDSHE